MSLYGNIKKIGSASFQFDRKYNNRAEMDAHASMDGVYAGRYVLVEYGYRFGLNDEDIRQVQDGTAISEIEHNFKLVNTADNSVRAEGVVENQAFKHNAAVDLYTYGAIYDSTVWQKVYVNENGQGKDKYVMVAELNASAPKLDIIQDKPLIYTSNNTDIQNYRTDGIVTGKLNENGELVDTVRLTNAIETWNKAHFDTAIDTELTYLMHIPTTLNLELGNNTVDFNENGFNMAYSYPESKGISAITWIPKGHDDEGNPIYLDQYDKKNDGNTDNAGNPFAVLQSGSYPMDTKMLFMSFPALGNAMNALYNLIYGQPDPNDDLTHGAMRPYFKQFLNTVKMHNRVIVYDRNNESQYVTYTNSLGELRYMYADGKVGESVEIILNPLDALTRNNVSPSEYVDIYFRDSSTNPIQPCSIRSSTFATLEKDERGIPIKPGTFLLWDIYRNQPLTMTVHTPNGDEDPDLDWLKDIPGLADILGNNTAGLATVLSSIFGSVDPLTGTTKYFLYNDWTASSEDGSTGPAIINKPKTVGGYSQEFIHVPAGDSGKNILGDDIYQTPGFMWDYGSTDLDTIDYPHTEILTSDSFSGGHYKIDFDNWQLIDYITPNIKITINKLMVVPEDGNELESQDNQDRINISKNNMAITFTSTGELNEFDKEDYGEGAWVGFDIDTGFKSIVKLKFNNYMYQDEDEDAMRSQGADLGHIIVWVNANNIIGIPQEFTISASGFNPITFTIQYDGVR